MITQKELKKLLHYDPLTGLFIRLKATKGARVGDIAGGKEPNGYIRISVQGRRYLAHRLAWLYMTGEWPKEFIDHDDRIRDNNKWLNLNEATNQENQRNQKLLKSNTSGVTGVVFHKDRGKWSARIRITGKYLTLGYFTDKFEAICSRMSSNNKYNFHENHGRG